MQSLFPQASHHTGYKGGIIMKNETKDRVIKHLESIEPFIEDTSKHLNEYFNFCKLYDLACIYEGIAENSFKRTEYKERQETLNCLLADVVTAHQELNPDFIHDSNYDNIEYTEGVHPETHIRERTSLFRASFNTSPHLLHQTLINLRNKADFYLEKIQETSCYIDNNPNNTKSEELTFNLDDSVTEKLEQLSNLCKSLQYLLEYITIKKPNSYFIEFELDKSKL